MHRSHEKSNITVTMNTEKDEFALLAIVEGISIGIEGRRNTADLAINAKDWCTMIRQGSMTLMEYYDKGKSKLAHGMGRSKVQHSH